MFTKKMFDDRMAAEEKERISFLEEKNNIVKRNEMFFEKNISKVIKTLDQHLATGEKCFGISIYNKAGNDKYGEFSIYSTTMDKFINVLKDEIKKRGFDFWYVSKQINVIEVSLKE